MAEVQAQRIVAEAQLRPSSGRQRMSAEEITRVVGSLRDLMSVLANAGPADKAQIYSQLGLALTYYPGSHMVRADRVRRLQLSCGPNATDLTTLPARSVSVGMSLPVVVRVLAGCSWETAA